MTCFKCKHEFCWLCRRKYAQDHFKKLNPLGCYGGQFDSRTPSKHPKLRVAALVIPRLIALLVLAIVKLLAAFVLRVVCPLVRTPFLLARRSACCQRTLQRSAPRVVDRASL